MTVTPGQLNELHRLHRQLTDLRDRLERGPKQIKACETNIKASEAKLAAIKESHKKTRMSADERQLQLKGREDHVLKLKVQLNTAQTNKEFQLIKEQMAADEQANSVLSDEIFEILEKIDQIEADAKAAAENIVKANEDMKNVRQRISEQQGSLESELGRVSAELASAEAKLSGDFKSDYKRMVKSRGEDAMAQVESETCGGCFTMLTSQTMNELLMAKPVFCKSCGRLLYLKEN